MTAQQKRKASEIRRQLRALRALEMLHREWDPDTLFSERRGSVHQREVSVHVNEAAGVLEARR